jgi:hypothetical protein
MLGFVTVSFILLEPLLLNVLSSAVVLLSSRALSCRLLLTLPEGATALVEAHIIELMKRLMTALAAAAGERCCMFTAKSRVPDHFCVQLPRKHCVCEQRDSTGSSSSSSSSR